MGILWNNTGYLIVFDDDDELIAVRRVHVMYDHSLLKLVVRGFDEWPLNAKY